MQGDLHTVSTLMILAGSVLMILNIRRYYGFTRRMHWMAEGRKNRLALYVPLLLLLLFLMGYLATALFGSPDLVMAGILLGGSIFVHIILSILYYIVDRVAENERQLFAAHEAGKARTAFFFNMSHDLRTPMNAILGYTQLARRPDTDAEQMHRYLDKIHASSQHLLALINDVLEMSRIENGRMELRPVPTDLHRVMQETEDLFAAQMKEKGLHFTLRDEAENACVLCDRERLNRVLLNLVSNAMKFTPEGGAVELTLLQTGRTADEGSYEIRVRDTGIGMNEDFAERVFDAFERERSSTVSGIQGTGLGMAITRNIVELMGGTISLTTRKGEGSEFVVNLCLPLLPSAEGAASQKGGCPCREEGELPSVKGLRLLLAEDNDINREIAALILEEIGFSLDTAENGRIALEMLQAAEAGTYAAVLMDIQMPEMDGFAATRAIRALPDARREIPIIAMTANAFREDVEAEREAGMDAHISKPVDVREMVQTLIRVLNLKTE